MWTFPTLEPALVKDGSFVLDRVLDRAGEVMVHVGDTVQPDTIIARAKSADRLMTVFVASELGVPASNVQRHLTKPVGSSFKAGDVIARARPGLRLVTVAAPAAGKIVGVDDANGTVSFSVSSGHMELRSLVRGEVERVVPDFGAVIRASGTRLFGILGFGTEAIGELLIGADRADRELTPDQVRDDWKGRLVVGGMTVGVPALNKLRQVGVAGIIVGSLSEADIRRFLTSGSSSSSEVRPGQFWADRHPEATFAGNANSAPFVVVATEGFGRIPMAEVLFNALRDYDGSLASVQAMTCVGAHLRRPEIYIFGGNDGVGARASDELLPGRPVRLVGGRDLGTVAICRSEAFNHTSTDGIASSVARVQLPDGEERVVAVSNIEVLH
jgi:hypothetical protein